MIQILQKNLTWKKSWVCGTGSESFSQEMKQSRDDAVHLVFIIENLPGREHYSQQVEGLDLWGAQCIMVTL